MQGKGFEPLTIVFHRGLRANTSVPQREWLVSEFSGYA
jgi:hypothetical protein